MYNKMSGEVDCTLKNYSLLSNKFIEFISGANDILTGIESLKINNINNETLLFNVIGKDIKIKFDMVNNNNYQVGQISAILINNKGKSTEIETCILSSWFDDLGNINYPTIEQNSTYNMLHNNYLKTFVYEAIHVISSSELMKPYINNY